jgi:hypothetical protein
MDFIGRMAECAEILRRAGLAPVVPVSDDLDFIEAAGRNEFKKRVSRAHFDEIADKETFAILVVNDRKNGQDNYIGASTFAEIALAFYFEKEIYVLNDLYSPYADELAAWGARLLRGNLQNITT